MNDQTKKRLEDILKCINEIEYFHSARPNRFDAFTSDLFYLRAVQMNIAVIGEAMNQILKEEPTIPISSARKIVNTRNYIIHGYDSLDNEILWGIVINHIPILKSEVTRLLNE